MSKPIQEQIFKSRLTITYRTNITGTVQQEKLPYRVVVLGEFSGRALRQANLLPDLGKRAVRSIKRGTTVNDHLGEVMPTFRIPAGDEFHALRSNMPGKVVFDRVRCAIPVGALERGETRGYSLSGTARFESSIDENGMCDVKGDLVVGGTLSVQIEGGAAKPDGAKIHLAGVVSGSYVDPATGKIVGTVTGHVDQSVSVATLEMLEDEDLAGTDAEAKTKDFIIKVEAQPARAERTIPFASMEAFTPDAVADSIPEVHRLRVIKRLLLDLQSGLRNRPELRKQMKSMLPGYGEKPAESSDKLTHFEDLKAWAEESFPLLKIERSAGK